MDVEEGNSYFNFGPIFMGPGNGLINRKKARFIAIKFPNLIYREKEAKPFYCLELNEERARGKDKIETFFW